MKLLLTITLTLTVILISSFFLYCLTKEKVWEEICDNLTICTCIVVVVSLTLSAWIVWR